MKKKTKNTGIIVLTALALCSLFLFTGCKKHGYKGAFALDYIAETLDLTEVQEEQLDSIKEEVFAEIGRIRQEKEPMHNTLKNQLTSENIDKEVIRQLIQNHRAKMDPVIALAVDRLSNFHATLSPAQREKLAEKLEDFEQHRAPNYKR